MSYEGLVETETATPRSRPSTLLAHGCPSDARTALEAFVHDTPSSDDTVSASHTKFSSFDKYSSWIA